MGKTKTFTNGAVVRRIHALMDIPAHEVKAGDIGGFLESEANLSHSGNAWVADDAIVCGDAKVSGNAWVGGKAKVWGDARVSGNAWVLGGATLGYHARVTGNTTVWC
jgi:carbonic anhydrase/acetyltransferase-like protein (isoleucine patch superfamily)